MGIIGNLAENLGKTRDEKFMRMAYREAEKAYKGGDVPIGCLIVQNGHVIAKGHNRRNQDKSALSHAEITAIRDACKKLGDWRLENVEMFVTLEPCPMCAGAIVQARIPRVVIGCMNPKAGSAGSVVDLLHMPGFNHQVKTEYGVMQAECSDLVSRFFSELREQSKGDEGEV
ncbi:MAG: tRNA adenosine(34) deaminase TadA [Lachnospiraceae bacterium]|nr:tRNA adenosine(34) deaminase TadA [Lachnospiraceae bacterium]